MNSFVIGAVQGVIAKDIQNENHLLGSKTFITMNRIFGGGVVSTFDTFQRFHF